MANIKTFPQVIFVTIEEDDDEDYMLATLTKRDALSDNTERIVGMYKFVASELVSEGQVTAKRRKTRATKDPRTWTR